MALAVGLAANESFVTGKFVKIADLALEGWVQANCSVFINLMQLLIKLKR
jgi:hypothetical protein